MSEQPATYETPRHGWTCFHCGETFSVATCGCFAAAETAAREHFGQYPGIDPACIERLTHDDKALLRRVRRAEHDASRAWDAVHRMEEQEAAGWAATVGAFLRRFPGAQTLNDVYHRYDSMEGRALAAEAIVAEAEKLAPHIIWKARETVCAPPSEPPPANTQPAADQKEGSAGKPPAPPISNP